MFDTPLFIIIWSFNDTALCKINLNLFEKKTGDKIQLKYDKDIFLCKYLVFIHVAK